jgi:hypothetical protein
MWCFFIGAHCGMFGIDFGIATRTKLNSEVGERTNQPSRQEARVRRPLQREQIRKVCQSTLGHTMISDEGIEDRNLGNVTRKCA